MAWPPTTHQDVQDEVAVLRATTIEPKGIRAASSIGTSSEAARADHTHKGPIGWAFREGDWTSAAVETSTTTASAAVTADGTMSVVPVYVPRAITLGRWYLHMTAVGTAGVLRFAVYDDDGTGYPGALRADLGTTPQTANTELASSVAVESGLHWVCVAFQGTGATAPTVRVATHPLMQLAGAGNPTGGALRTCYVLSGVTGVPPATFPAITDPNVGTGQHSPRIAMWTAL